MVARYASSRVPRFASLIDFMRAKKLYYQALQTIPASEALGIVQTPCPAPGPERTNLEQRLRRHGIPPDSFTIQIRFKRQHIHTLGTHSLDVSSGLALR